MLDPALSRYGAAAKAKLSNPAVSGEPEEQLRGPVEALIHDLAALAGLPKGHVVLVGEAALPGSRPDFAVTARGALVGFVELKRLGKGANPNRFTDKHDKAQWAKLRSLPNLLYSDGESFGLWRDGAPAGAVKGNGASSSSRKPRPRSSRTATPRP